MGDGGGGCVGYGAGACNDLVNLLVFSSYLVETRESTNIGGRNYWINNFISNYHNIIIIIIYKIRWL